MEEYSTSTIPLLNLPDVEELCLEETVAEAQQICITVASFLPVCGVALSRVQSRYERTAAGVFAQFEA